MREVVELKAILLKSDGLEANERLSPLINKVFDKFCSQNGEAKFGGETAQPRYDGICDTPYNPRRAVYACAFNEYHSAFPIVYLRSHLISIAHRGGIFAFGVGCWSRCCS